MKNQTFNIECLEQHNIFRRLHCVKELNLSHDLARSAQHWADYLIKQDSLEVSSMAKNGEVGENITSRTTTSKKFQVSGTEIAQKWYDDIKNYDFTTATGNAGNFTQMIWGSTSEVGFGVAHNKNKYVIVAHYSPAGNMTGGYTTNVFPLADANVACVDPSEADVAVNFDGACAFKTTFYKDPFVCSENTVCGDISVGVCPTVGLDIQDAGLEANIGADAVVTSGPCYFKAVNECIQKTISYEEGSEGISIYSTPLVHARSDSMSSDENFELELRGLPELCMVRKREMRQFVRHTIAGINKLRVLHGVPILKHNKELDRLSQEWAAEVIHQSPLVHSENKYNGEKVGENVASRWSNVKVDYNADELVEHFYDEHKKYLFDEEHYSVYGFGNFTQMMWKSTKEIGIGKAFLKKDKDHKVVVVCSFYPAGNVIGHFSQNVLPPLPKID